MIMIIQIFIWCIVKDGIGKIKYYTDKEYTVEELKNINDKITLDMNMSNLAIKNNYFNYLYKNVHNKNIDTELENE